MRVDWKGLNRNGRGKGNSNALLCWNREDSDQRLLREGQLGREKGGWQGACPTERATVAIARLFRSGLGRLQIGRSAGAAGMVRRSLMACAMTRQSRPQRDKPQPERQQP